MGLFISELPDNNQLREVYARVQNDLFDLGGELAMTTAEERVDIIQASHNQHLELVLTGLNDQLAPLKNFILPGGSRLLALCHVVRSVTRRVERALSKLSETGVVNPQSLVYLNRLSDLAFVSARWLAKELEIEEVLWTQNENQT